MSRLGSFYFINGGALCIQSRPVASDIIDFETQQGIVSTCSWYVADHVGICYHFKLDELYSTNQKASEKDLKS